MPSPEYPFDNVSQIEDIVYNLSQKQKQLVFVAAAFFWFKYQRQRQFQEDFHPSSSTADFSTATVTDILQDALQRESEYHADREGNTVTAYVEYITEERNNTYFASTLTPSEIDSFCSSLEDIFNNQEYCAFCELWSYWDVQSAEEFVFTATPIMLEFANNHETYWYREINSPKTKRDTIAYILMKLHQQNKKDTPLYLPKNQNPNESTQ